MSELKQSKASLFLIEAAIMTLVFAISAAVCLQMFAEAEALSRDSRNLSNAQTLITTACSSYKAFLGDLPEVAGVLNGHVAGDGSVTVFYSEGLQPQAEEGSYLLKLVPNGESCLVSVYAGSGEEPVLSVETMTVGQYGQ